MIGRKKHKIIVFCRYAEHQMVITKGTRKTQLNFETLNINRAVDEPKLSNVLSLQKISKCFVLLTFRASKSFDPYVIAVSNHR